MVDPVAALSVLAALLFVYSVLSAQRHRRDVEKLRSEIDSVEGLNRRLHDERDALTAQLEEKTATIENLHERLRQLADEKAEVERRRVFLEEVAARLEKARAELEAQLTALQSEHSSLKTRVVDFQGEWNRQLSTVEEEIGTLMRQLGEFRKGTRLPISAASD